MTQIAHSGNSLGGCHQAQNRAWNWGWWTHTAPLILLSFGNVKFYGAESQKLQNRGIYAPLPLFCTILCDGHSRFEHISTISPICSAARKRMKPQSCTVASKGGIKDLYIFTPNVRTSNTTCAQTANCAKILHFRNSLKRTSVSGAPEWLWAFGAMNRSKYFPGIIYKTQTQKIHKRLRLPECHSNKCPTASSEPKLKHLRPC